MKRELFFVRIAVACVTSLVVVACGSDPSSSSGSSSGASPGSFGSANAFDQACSQTGETQTCWTGDPSQRGKGACHDGVQTCVSQTRGEFSTHTWGPCTGEQHDCGDDSAGGAPEAVESPGNTTASGPSRCPMLAQCNGGTVPSTLKVTISGFETCTCFNGTFTLTRAANGIWVSPPITGCPGQIDTAYMKFADNSPIANDGFSINDLTSTPGNGHGSYACPTTVDCAPFQATGGNFTAGSIMGFCGGTVVDYRTLHWTITP